MTKKPNDIRLKDITGKECMIGQYLEDIDCVEFKHNHSCHQIIPCNALLQDIERKRNK